MDVGPSRAVTGPCLPRTIEEATRRYLNNYTKNFSGPAHEMARLKAMTKALIYRLRKVAPRFYEDKLPTFINQACSTLLTFETSKHEDTLKFHLCHRSFMQILEGFSQSQPAGEVNFHNERMRLEERMKLIQRQVQLEAMIDKLEATEFDYDEIGEDDAEGEYAKLVRELDYYKAEMKRVSIELAYIEGLQVEEEPHFELIVQPRSLLSRLTLSQRASLEKQMFDLVKENKNKRTAMFVDKSIIDSMIEKLNIDPGLFNKTELMHLSKDALDAYKEYFRRIDEDHRNQFYKELCERKSLQPREGLILKGPDDVPDDIRMKLEANTLQCKREIEEIFDTFSKRPCADDTGGDMVSDDDDDADEKTRILDTVRRKGIKFERVKEEPRDDCEAEYLVSGDEVEVDDRIATAIVNNKSIQYATRPQAPPRSESDEENDGAQYGVDTDNSSPRGEDDTAEVKMETNGCSDGISSGANDDDDEDEDIECLGTIEPGDRVVQVDLTEHENNLS